MLSLMARPPSPRAAGAAFLSALTPQGRARLERTMTRRVFAAGASVIEKGERVSGAVFVLSGALRVFALSPSGRESSLYVLRAGDTCVLALNSLFADLRYPAHVRADAQTCVGVAPGPTFRALFDSEESIRDLTVRALSTLVFRLMDELEQVRSRRLDQRLAGAMLALADSDGAVRWTQQRLADHLGASREAVARIQAHLAASGAIETGRGVVRLRDSAALSRLASED